MIMTEELRQKFESFVVGPGRRFQLPGNVGPARTVVPICRRILESPEPFLYKTLVGWDKHQELLDERGGVVNVLAVCLGLWAHGQWEGAWAVAQLYYDQLLKREAASGDRLHKGHPACGLAILAREIGSPALSRHYAMLSSAGDLYWEHKDPDLSHGGYAVTMLEQFESFDEHDRWRAAVRRQLKELGGNAIYLEAFVAAKWFSDAFAQRVLTLAKVSDKEGKPFVEVLLDAVKDPINESAGTRFEAAAGLLLASTPGFEVRSSRQTTDAQTDLVVWYSPDRLTRLPMPAGPGLVECKSSKRPVGVDELRDFGAKCLFHRVGFGILIARTGITGKGPPELAEPTHAELVRRRFQVDGLTLLLLDMTQLRDKARELRGLQEELAADYDRLVFGPIAGDAVTRKRGAPTGAKTKRPRKKKTTKKGR